MSFELEAGAAWRNLAWGFEDGSADDASGAEAVLVDLDISASEMAGFKDAGTKVICYFSVGTVEPWREDTESNKDAWMAVAVGELAEWDEYWIDITSDDARTLLLDRFNRAKSSGCDALELDNVDCYQNSECWPNIAGLTTQAEAKAAQIAFNTWQITTAHGLSLGIGLKNALSLIEDMADDYDFAINESCLEYGECEYYKPFLAANKAVLHTEYIWAQAACASTTPIDTTVNKLVLSSKYCTGSDGLCTRGNHWETCFVDMAGQAYASFDPDTAPRPSAATRATGAPSLVMHLIVLLTFLFLRHLRR